MPAARKYAKRRAARRTRRRKGKRKLPIGAPNKEVVCLRYSGRACLDLTGVATNGHLFSCNSMYDPDESGVGHQPRCFDQYMALYDHYTVLGAKIRVQAHNRQTTTQGVIVAVTTQDDNVNLVGLDDLMEYRNRKSRTLSNERPDCFLTQTYSCKKFFHVKPLTASEQRGDAGTSPADGAYFGLYIATMDGAIGTDCVDCVVTIDYIVAFTERKQPTKS